MYKNVQIQFKNLENFQKFTCSDACVNPLVDTVICVAGFKGTVNIRNIYHEHAQQSNYIYLYRANGCGWYVCLCFDWCHHSFTEMAIFNSIFNRCYFRSVLPFGQMVVSFDWMIRKKNWILPTTMLGFQFETKRESTMNKWETSYAYNYSNEHFKYIGPAKWLYCSSVYSLSTRMMVF